VSNNNWVEHELANKIITILREVPAAHDHHLGRPFLTAYQIAIALNEKYPEAVADLDYPIGGRGAGRKNSVAQYVAQNLSREIKARRLGEIEGGFLSNEYLNDIAFDSEGDVIHSSLTHTPYTLSLFRVRS
jgi:hypothetical protein